VGASRVSDDAVRLATPEAALLFDGFAEHPVITAKALSIVAKVAQTRFYEPPTMVAARIRAADPVVTSEPGALHFESFSRCCGLHCRYDILATDLDTRVARPGTTNVDFGPDMLTALRRIHRRDPMRLTVGVNSVSVESFDFKIHERRVPLPERWVRGFAEVQAALIGAQPIIELGASDARRFVAGLPGGRDGTRNYWTAGTGAGLRLSPRTATGGVNVAAPLRLRILEPILPLIESLTVYAHPDPEGPAPTAWVLTLPGGRLSVTLSPDWKRGFSGEGGLLIDLASPTAAADAELLNVGLRSQPRFTAIDAIGKTGLSHDRWRSAMTWLGAHGEIGHDLTDDAYYWRQLPYPTAALSEDPPRLRDAKRLLAGKSGHVEEVGPGVFRVFSQDCEYRTEVSTSGFSCTCEWVAKHGTSRGPCKHVLAGVLAGAADSRLT
jgi:hypothetical protein